MAQITQNAIELTIGHSVLAGNIAIAVPTKAPTPKRIVPAKEDTVPPYVDSLQE